MPGNIVFRWYDRVRADDIYRSWTGEQLQQRLEAAKKQAGKQPPLGNPTVATTDSLEHLLRDWRAQGWAGQRISQIPAGRPSDLLLRYELLCDACTQAEWRAKEAFFLRHLSGLGDGDSPREQADLAATYAASRAGQFHWREWSLLTEGLERLDWERWVATFQPSYEADKATRRAGVEQSLRQHYQAFEELRRLLQDGEERGWALAVYEANDERLPFPPPAILDEAVRQTEAEVAGARLQAEATLARRRRLQRVVVPLVLVLVFLLLGFLFTQSLVGAASVAAIIVLIIGAVVAVIIRRSQ